MSLQFDGGAFAPSDVPHDDRVVRAAGEEHPLHRVPAQRRDVTWGKAQNTNMRRNTWTPRSVCKITHSTAHEIASLMNPVRIIHKLLITLTKVIHLVPVLRLL